MREGLSVNGERLMASIFELGKAGALDDGGVCRLALTREDGAGREYVVRRMRELGLTVTIDGIGNIFGFLPGREETSPVMMGSHIDTVATGGLYDGNYGVLAALEVVATLRDKGITPRRSVVAAVFTNEEGVRFHPDMMGSLIFVGDYPLEKALATPDHDGVTIAQALRDIGFAGTGAIDSFPVDHYLELHIEQGPVLDGGKIDIGVVEGVQGISWTEFTLVGVANHAGTTPMAMRKDAGYVAAKIMAFAHDMAHRLGNGQVATVGRVSEFAPGMVNVVPNKVVFTVDLRNYSDDILKQAEKELWDFADKTAAEEGVLLSRESLVRFPPVVFDARVKDLIEEEARSRNLTTLRLPSGAGHDAQMLARVCPTGMIFVPNRDGISHNVNKYAEPEHLTAGANVLLQVALGLADRD